MSLINDPLLRLRWHQRDVRRHAERPTAAEQLRPRLRPHRVAFHADALDAPRPTHARVRQRLAERLHPGHALGPDRVAVEPEQRQRRELPSDGPGEDDARRATRL